MIFMCYFFMIENGIIGYALDYMADIGKKKNQTK